MAKPHMPELSDCSVDGIPNATERRFLDLGIAAKGVCSGLFVSRRALDDIIAQSEKPETSDGSPIDFDINPDAARVSASTADGLVRHAVHCGDQGAVLLPIGSHKAFFEPRTIDSPLPPAKQTPWPMGDAGIPAEPRNEKIQQAIDLCFREGAGAFTAAMVVVHKGQIIGERYSPGISPDTQLQSWSMGKSLVASLIGRLMHLGHLHLDAPAPLEEWQTPGDPRGEITIRHLLNMSSGLNFTAHWKEDFKTEHGYPDHTYMYRAAVDVEKLALSRPLSHRPGTFGAYQNSDTLALLAIAKRIGKTLGIHPLELPQRLLLDKIGIRNMSLETDPYGNHVLTGFNFGTPRDWARLGLLWLQDGVWQGERLLGDGFVDFARTPAPAWRGKYWMMTAPENFTGSVYGGQVFLNNELEEDRWPIPGDAFFMLGIAGQVTCIVPSLDLVVVRFGHFRAVEQTTNHKEPLATSLKALVDFL